MDKTGSVYVTGITTGSSIGGDYTTIKYDINGDIKWVARYDYEEDNLDWATSIAIDNNRNVYVTGASVGLGASFDFATIKYRQNTLIHREPFHW